MTQSELFDEREVPSLVVVLQVLEESTTTTNELEQAAAGVVILLVACEVTRQLVDASGEKRDLNLRGTGIAILLRELLMISAFSDL